MEPALRWLGGSLAQPTPAISRCHTIRINHCQFVRRGAVGEAFGGAAREGAELSEGGVALEDLAGALYEALLAALDVAGRAIQGAGEFADGGLFVGLGDGPTVFCAAGDDFATDGGEARGVGEALFGAGGGAIDAVADALAEGGRLVSARVDGTGGMGEGAGGDVVAGGEADDAGRGAGVVAGFFVAEAASPAALGAVGDADGAMGFVDEAADGEVDAGHSVGGEGAVARRVMGADGVDEGEAAFLDEFGVATSAAEAGDPFVETIERVVDEGEMGFDESALSGGEGVEGNGGAGRHGSSFRNLSLGKSAAAKPAPQS